MSYILHWIWLFHLYGKTTLYHQSISISTSNWKLNETIFCWKYTIWQRCLLLNMVQAHTDVQVVSSCIDVRTSYMTEHCLVYCDCAVEQDVSSSNKSDDTVVKYTSLYRSLMILHPTISYLVLFLFRLDNTYIHAGAFVVLISLPFQRTSIGTII